MVHMPKATIYIRKEDEEIWKSIKDRPEWIHKMLTEHLGKMMTQALYGKKAKK